MEKVIYRFEFTTPVHFGDNKLENSESFIYADTIFSALCIESKKIFGEEGLEKLVDYFKKGKLLISDGMPYHNKEYYIPKPIMQIEQKNIVALKEIAVKKKLKKLDYINIKDIFQFIKGEYDFSKENYLENMGKKEIRQNVSLIGTDTEPFNTGIYSFNKGYGLYILVQYESKEVIQFLETIMDSLSYTGIGGKKSSGFGKFILKKDKISKEYENLLNNKANINILISIAMFKNEEVEKLSKDDSYLLVKRSGFVSSTDYSTEYRKKKDIFMFKSGSCFKERFKGDIFDVSNGGKHKVYKYGKAFWIGV